MNDSVWVLIIALLCMVGGVYIGSWLRERLPQHHLGDDATGVIKSGVGLLSTLSALILGLLISTAKISYDSTETQINQITSDLVLVDQLLAQYGPAGQEARQTLRDQAVSLGDSIWNSKSAGRTQGFVPSGAYRAFVAALNQLPSATDQQRNLRKEIDELIKRSTQARLRLFAEAGGALPIPFVGLLVFWLTIIFASYSLLGAMNATVRAFVFLFAMSAAGALFLISELNTPFSGMLKIPESQMINALAILPK